jgi:hypothetical protein
MALVAMPANVSEVSEGDEVTFAYRNSKKNGVVRVGQVIRLDWQRETLLIWDYSLHKGPAYHTYSFRLICDLARIDDGDFVDTLQGYRNSLKHFGESL